MARIIAMILLSVLAVSTVNGLQHGKVQIGDTAAAGGVYCKTVTFPSSFTGSDPVKVFTSLSLGSSSSHVHDVGFTWIESENKNGFKACVLESGTGFNGKARLNWIAYQGPESSVAEGVSKFNDFTTGTKCNRVFLSKSFPSKPKVFVTARHKVLNRRQDAAAVWVEGISRDDFTICLREARTFDGRHKDIEVVWMAFTDVPPSWGKANNMTQLFPNSAKPKEEDNDAYCQIVKFTKPYVLPPASIVLTPSHECKCSDEGLVIPKYNSIVAWNEEITTTYFKSCVKDLVGLSSCKSHPITVDYLVVPDPDPCINKTCDNYGKCEAVSSAQCVAQCVCDYECPTNKSLVCATNGQTYDNRCIMEREICKAKGNFSYDHPGPCHVDLKFAKASITNYVITKTLPAMTAMTFCYWMKTADTKNKGTPFSYDLKGGIDEFVSYDYRDLELYINGDYVSTDIVANDGKWHHICATWSNTAGSWVAYKDGKSVKDGTGFKTGYEIKAGGALIVAQEQDSEGGNFEAHQSFVGELTELNIWNRVLGPSEISKMSGTCHSGEGNVLSWSDVLSGTFKGEVQKLPSSCQ